MQANSSSNAVKIVYDYSPKGNSGEEGKFVFESPNHVRHFGTAQEFFPAPPYPAKTP